MNQYMKTETPTPQGKIQVSIIIQSDRFTNFPAVVGNPNYDAFLEQAKLTDTQVKALKPDTWYDFPEGE